MKNRNERENKKERKLESNARKKLGEVMQPYYSIVSPTFN